jgi:hypothetical protein
VTRYKYPPYVAGLVDIDYWDKLTDADRKWLQKFSAEYYADHFTRTPIHTSQEHQDECSRRYSQARRDAAPFAFSVETSARGPGSKHFSDLDEKFKWWGHLPRQLDVTDLDLERPGGQGAARTYPTPQARGRSGRQPEETPLPVIAARDTVLPASREARTAAEQQRGRGMTRWRIDKGPGCLQFRFNLENSIGNFVAVLPDHEARILLKDGLRHLNEKRIKELEAELAQLKAEIGL